MKKVFTIIFILAIFISACGVSSSTTLPENETLSTSTITPTALSGDEEWKLIKSIATEDKTIQQENLTNDWSEFLLSETIIFSSGLQIRLNMESKGVNGILLESKEPGKRLEIFYEGQRLNVHLRDGSQEEPIYNNQVSLPSSNDYITTGEIIVIFDNHARNIKIEHDGKTLMQISLSTVGDFPNGLFPDGQIAEIRGSNGANSSVKLTGLEFLVPSSDYAALIDETSTTEEEWKVVNGIANENRIVQNENLTDYWSATLLARAITFSSELQLKLNMESTGVNGIILTATKAGPDFPWWKGSKQFEIFYESQSLNVHLRDGSQEEPIYNNQVPLPSGHDEITTGEIIVTFDHQARNIKIEHNNDIIMEIPLSTVGDFPNGLFPDNQVMEVELSSGVNSSVKLTKLEFLVPSLDYAALLDPTPTVSSTINMDDPKFDFPITAENANQVRQLAIWGKGLPWAWRDSYWYNPKINKDLGELWLSSATRVQGNLYLVETPRGLYAYSIEDGSLLYEIDNVSAYKVSFDGNLIITGHNDASVRVWNALDGKLIKEIHYKLTILKDFYSIGPNITPTVGDVAISRDEKKIAAGFADEKIVVWDMNDTEHPITLYITPLATWRVGVRGIEFSPDGDTLLSLSESGTNLWRLSDGRSLWQINAGWPILGGNLVQPTFSPDGKMFGFLRGNVFWVIDNNGDIVYDRSSIADERVRYNISNDWKEYTIDYPVKNVREIKSLSDGKLIKRMSLDEADETPPIPLYDSAHVWGLLGAKVLTDHTLLAWGFTNEFFYWWYPEQNKFVKFPKDEEDVFFSEDGIQSGRCENGKIILLDSYGQEKDFLVSGHSTCDGIVFSPTHDAFAVWAKNRLTLVSISTGESQALKLHQKNVIAVAFSLDGRLLASVADSVPSEIVIWDIKESKKLFTIKDQDIKKDYRPPYFVMKFSPDNSLLATRSYGRPVRLWKTEDGSLLGTINAAGDKITFSPDGKILATANRAGIVSLWKTLDGSKLSELRGHAHLFERITGVNDYIPILSFSPDGLDVLSVEHEDLYYPNDFLHSISNISFLPDGTGVLSVGVDGTIRLWGIDPNVTEAVPSPPITRPVFENLTFGQSVNFDDYFLFKIIPVPDAKEYFWEFWQNNDNSYNSKIICSIQLSFNELEIDKESECGQKIRRGRLVIVVYALINGQWIENSTVVMMK
ncbi:MAG: WD40 repeat domain-containing protein [bacterium]|nr:WD40 repeat domain-containing protein [bacterium]